VQSVINSIKQATQGKNGHAVLYAGIIGLILSDIIPTPADALYFATERNLRNKWAAGKITPQKYWQKSALAYYTYNPAWWLIVLAGTYFYKGELNQKMKLALAVIGTGAVIGIIGKSLKKDIEEVRQSKNDAIYPPPTYANASGSTKPSTGVIRNGRVMQLQTPINGKAYLVKERPKWQ
jgi:hypothetical protein